MTARRAPVAAQPVLVGLPGRPRDVAGVMVGDQHLPVLDRQQPGPGNQSAVGIHALDGPGPTEHERTGIGGVGQQVVHGRIRRLRPRDPRMPAPAPGQQNTVLAQRHEHLPGRSELGEPGEHTANRGAHRLVRGEHHPTGDVVVQAHRQPLA
jgi:hypothetical protein